MSETPRGMLIPLIRLILQHQQGKTIPCGHTKLATRPLRLAKSANGRWGIAGNTLGHANPANSANRAVLVRKNKYLQLCRISRRAAKVSRIC